MMLLSIILVIVATVCLEEVNADCQMVGWSQSFKRESLSQCSNYIRGFMVNGKDGEENIDIGLLEGVECCTAPYPWYLSKLQTVHQNWWYAFDSRGLVSCPEGFFLRGLRRTLASPGYPSNIEEGRCSKPADHPHYYNGHCLIVDISKCTSGMGLCKCPDDYFVAGLGRDVCNQLSCLKELKCCRMLDKPKHFSGINEIKERIMDITHSNLAQLGNYLGYGWAAGCMAASIGEGYKRVGDTMEADESFKCEGYKSDHRLNLAYGNWKFELKNITYGERIFHSLNPETISSGVEVNNDSFPVTKEIQLETRVVREIRHIVDNSWKEDNTLGIIISYTNSEGKKWFAVPYKNASTVKDSENNEDSRTLTIIVSKTLEPNSRKKWSIYLHKTKTTTPYTAAILVKFTLDLQGFLRWGGGYHGEDTNYHQQYRGSEDRPTFHYQFGDASEPFYSALKKQSSRNSPPWQWDELKTKYPDLKTLIDDLAKESHYEFTLSGKFEDVIGTNTQDRWDDITKVKRETLASGSP